ncbi:MAG: FtsQ-type POTRA domain-containing protein [Xanthomonadales bacterium]|nr:FtsQ-type POTRA domain-containing protein [Xanthomonadales bacterium]MBP6078723.1 FtsQ-type POTRA domain-containing protein [Xanthomonadales bacterium]MBP7623414.1 FtsQ-type POTRA domain-containing protein [Xanthomonadales bacterium]
MNPRLARIAAWMIALALVATPIIAALNGWLADERWPIRRLVVQGRFVQVDEASVRAVVAPQVRAGFFAVELDAVKTAVEALPWVESAEVRKHWPDRIDVRVEERVPIAFWGDDRLLSQRGDVFAAELARVSPDLPHLDGPDARAAEVWAQHRHARERLADIGIEIRATRMNQRGAWMVLAADGAEFVLGREQTDARLERFILAMRRLPAAEHSRIARADLRFANGFAVVWRAVETAPASTAPATPETESRSLHEPQV